MLGLKETLYKLAVHWYFHLHFLKVMEANIISGFLDLEGGERICDVACGSGQVSIKMAKAGCRVYGIDIMERATRCARLIGDKHNCSFLLGNAEALPYKSSVFNKVVCICALEHFNDDNKALKEMSRVLKPGGILVLTVDSFSYRGIKNHLQETHRHNHHVVNYYTDLQLAAILESLGFEVVETQYFISSPISAFFFNLGETLRWGIPFLVLFPIAYLLSVLSDCFWGRRDEGYFLAVKAAKSSDLHRR